jgi:predicted NBD/HSP70 family sugar kinase
VELIGGNVRAVAQRRERRDVKHEQARHPTVKVGVSARARKIKKVYMAVIERTGGEEVFTIVGPDDERIPIVATNDADLAALSEYARGQAKATQQSVSIICFTTRSHYETFRPVTTGDNE